MSKKANLITLRKNVISDFKIVESNSSLLIKYLKFLKLFIFLLQKKGFWVLQSTLLVNKSLCKINLHIFISTKKIQIFKKKKIKKKLKNNNFYLKNLHKLIFYFIQKLNCLLNIKNLNLKLDKNYLKYFLFKIKKFKNVLFQRRFNLFFDTLKIITLVYQKQIHSSNLLLILSNIFKFLSKKLHSKFLSFIEILVYTLVYNEFLNDRRALDASGVLKGIKFKINGKLRGKMRASSFLIQYGKTPNQSIDANIEYSMMHTYTRYGAFGLHLWLYK